MASKERARALVKGACLKVLREHSTKVESTHIIFADVSSLPNKAGALVQKEYVERQLS